MISNLTIVKLCFLWVGSCESANILFYFGIAGHSHVNSLWPLIVKMGEMGHNMTLLTSFKPKLTSPYVNTVYSEETYKLMVDEWDEGSDLVNNRIYGNKQKTWIEIHDVSLYVCEKFLTDPTTHNVVYNSKFDLMVVDSAFNDCGLAVAYYYYKCPHITYAAISLLPTFYEHYGFPAESSSIPDIQAEFGVPMSFFQKVYSTLQPIRWWLYEKYYYYPKLSTLLKEKLQLEEMPDFYQVKTNTSLVLSSTHYSKDYARSQPQLFVEVAGIHISENPKALSNQLEEFVSKPGSEGFIYISFGSLARISMCRPELRQKLFNTVGNFSNFQFVWKWEGKFPIVGTYPSNIYFSNWLSQVDVLAHKRIRGMIGQGGSNSIHEAVHFGVPLLLFPIFGDQDYNANSMAARGLAIVMEIGDFTQNEFTNNLNKLVYDLSFRKRTMDASILFRDRPMKPIDTAVWWIEYVLRHGDSNNLMPLAVSQSWYERRLLDVWLFLFGVATFLIFTVLLITHYILSSLLSKFSLRNHSILLKSECNSKMKSM